MNRKPIKIVALLLCLLFCSSATVRAQALKEKSSGIENKDLYESAKMQLDYFLENTPPADSMAFYLEQEAEYFAEQQEWETALLLINDALNSLAIEPAQDSPEDIEPWLDQNLLPVTTPNWQWSLELGTDYSRQEYEMNYLESDSVILEQLNNPYLSLRLYRNSSFRQKPLYLNSYLRGDRELLQTSFSAAMESPGYSRYWRLEGRSNLYYLHQDNPGSFWENEALGNYNVPLALNTRLALYSQLRYKIHFPSDSVYGNILSEEVSASLRQQLGLLSWMELMLRQSVYNEDQALGLKYSQLHSRLELERRSDFRKYLILQLNHYYRTFRSRQPGNDIRNAYNSLAPYLEAETPLLLPFGIFLRSELESRWYNEPDLSHSDFVASSNTAELKYYFRDFNSVGIGFLYETETHRTDSTDQRELIEQQNFHANGLAVSLDIMNTNELLLSLAYQYTLRTYPNAGADDLLGFYSNRKIHSIQGIGYIPLASRWQLQFFANYDNDRDRDREANDNFNTIFTLGIIYDF